MKAIFIHLDPPTQRKKKQKKKKAPTDLHLTDVLCRVFQKIEIQHHVPPSAAAHTLFKPFLRPDEHDVVNHPGGRKIHPTCHPHPATQLVHRFLQCGPARETRARRATPRVVPRSTQVGGGHAEREAHEPSRDMPVRLLSARILLQASSIVWGRPPPCSDSVARKLMYHQPDAGVSAR